MSISGGLPGGQPRRVWSWQRWLRYYRHNARTLLPIAWERGVELTPPEREVLLPSLREFQQGEGLEGGHFFRCVRHYAARTGAWDYVEVHRLFMAEEQRHAQTLARFLDAAGVPLLTERSFLNRLFCWIGSRGRLEWTLAIILMVEVCSLTYYGLLRKASGSRVLQQICSQVQHDEVFHVRFQCEVLARLRRGRRGLRRVLTKWLDRFLFVGAGLACWWGHRRALRRGGVGWSGFWREAWRHLHRARALKDPDNFAWDGMDGVGAARTNVGRSTLAGK